MRRHRWLGEIDTDRQQVSRTRLLAVIAVPLVCLSVYIGGYAILSLHGSFEPRSEAPLYRDSDGRIPPWGFGWAPSGFTDGHFTWRQSACVAFWPMLYLDWRLWHTSDKALQPGYPIHRYADET